MSDEILSPLLTLGVIVILTLWVPTLNFCYGRCRRLAELRQSRVSRRQSQHSDRASLMRS
jgi:hypothetical protein